VGSGARVRAHLPAKGKILDAVVLDVEVGHGPEASEYHVVHTSYALPIKVEVRDLRRVDVLSVLPLQYLVQGLRAQVQFFLLVLHESLTLSSRPHRH